MSRLRETPESRRAVTVVIRGESRNQVLTVQRPPDDPELPDTWGLPATSLQEGETEEEAVLRVGREKLGVELALDGPVAAGDQERPSYVLSMRAHEARIRSGAPSVPQPGGAGTQYVQWRWAPLETLRPAADRGSLCSRLLLEAEGQLRSARREEGRTRR